MNEDDPVNKRVRLLFSQAYTEHIYRHPIIGYEDVIRKISKDDIKRYHSAVYTPERMVVGIVGGVPGPKAVDVAGEKFGSYERGLSGQAMVLPEPRQMDKRSVRFPEDITLGYFAMGFHTTSLYSEDLYAGDVLSIMLGEGNNSLLNKRLVKEKQLLYDVSSLNYTPKYPGVLIIAGVGDADKLEDAEKEIFAVIDELKHRAVEESELDRAKNLVISDYLHSHERISAVVSSLTSSYLMTGDPGFFEKYVNEVKKVKAEDISKVAGKYLFSDNSTTVFLLPREYSQKTGKGSEAKVKEEKTKYVMFGNEMKIIVKQVKGVPLVSVSFAVPGGLREEENQNNGISNLTAGMLLKGTTRRDEAEIVPEIEGLGGDISPFSGMNSLGISMDVLADDTDKGLEIFEDVVKNPSFPVEELEKEKKKIIAAINEQEENIFENGIIYLRKLLYKDHPYGMRVLGRKETVFAITRNDVAKFYEDHFVPQGSVITVVGDVEIEETIIKLAKKFAGWRGKRYKEKVNTTADFIGRRKVDILMRREQAIFLAGFKGVSLDDERKYPLFVISALLSGTDGLLFQTVREKEGIAYASGAIFSPEVDPGYFIIYVATTEENLEKAEEMIISSIGSICEGKIEDADIEASKMRLISEQAYLLETNHAVSMTMALEEICGLGYLDHEKYASKIAAVSKEDITECAREILDLEKLGIVMVHSSSSDTRYDTPKDQTALNQ